MGLLFTLVRVVIAVLLCVVIAHDLPEGCSGVLAAADAPVPRVSALFVVLAVLPEPLPQIALLWRTTSASCCVLTVALSVVHPHTAMLFFAAAKGYAHHHPVLFALAAARALLGVARGCCARAARSPSPRSRSRSTRSAASSARARPSSSAPTTPRAATSSRARPRAAAPPPTARAAPRPSASASSASPPSAAPSSGSGAGSLTTMTMTAS